MKLDEEGKELVFEKVLPLYDGISIWKVAIERCREQDKNAQVMDKVTFDRLVSNVESDKRLESLPLGYIGTNPAGNQEFFIISGHHRIRAARSAGLTEIFVMAFDEKPNNDQIVAKQLAHNALVGDSDKQVLKELFDSIRDIDQKVASGIRDSEFDNMKFRPVKADDISVDFDFKIVKLVFLPSQIDKLEMVISQIDPEDKVYLADRHTFDKFAQTIRQVSKNEDIRNIASIVDRMCDICREYVKNNPREDEPAKQSTGRKPAKSKPAAKLGGI